jgi:hypothetical protein
MVAATPFWHRRVWDGIDAVVSNPDVLALLLAWRALPRNDSDLPNFADFAIHADHAPDTLRRFAPTVMGAGIGGRVRL